MRYITSFVFVLLATGVGCNHYHSESTETTVVKHDTAPPPPPADVVVAPRPVTMDSIILDVRQAPDPGAEAAALNRLHAWMSDHSLTYSVSVSDNVGRPVANASGASFPVNAAVSISDHAQPIRDFSFVPKDNRNLAILGVQ